MWMIGIALGIILLVSSFLVKERRPRRFCWFLARLCWRLG